MFLYNGTHTPAALTCGDKIIDCGNVETKPMKLKAPSFFSLHVAQAGLAVSLALILVLLVTAPSMADRLYEIAYTGCGGVDAPIVNEAYEARVVELVNEVRAANGNLPPLRRISALSKSARYHATDLGTDNYFSHDTYDRNGGALQKVCGAFERMRKWYSYNAAGENIAAGYSTPEDVMAGWMSSSGHRQNILDPDFREIGVGYYQGAGEYGVYWVQNLGARNGEYPLIINNDAATTSDPNVTVFVHGNWSEMRLRNDSGAWSEWQPFQSSFTWTLESVAGEHILSAELRSGATTYSTCDKISLASVAVAAPVADYQVYLPVLASAGQQVQQTVTCE